MTPGFVTSLPLVQALASLIRGDSEEDHAEWYTGGVERGSRVPEGKETGKEG